MASYEGNDWVTGLISTVIILFLWDLWISFGFDCGLRVYERFGCLGQHWDLGDYVSFFKWFLRENRQKHTVKFQLNCVNTQIESSTKNNIYDLAKLKSVRSMQYIYTYFLFWTFLIRIILLQFYNFAKKNKNLQL